MRQARVRAAVILALDQPRGEASDRRRGSRYHLGRGDQPVTLAVDGLDVLWILGVVTQGSTQLGNGAGQSLLGNELGGPDGVGDLAARHQLPGPLRQAHQNVHHLELDLDGLDSSGQAVEARLHQPVGEPKRGLPQLALFSCCGHLEMNVGRPSAECQSRQIRPGISSDSAIRGRGKRSETEIRNPFVWRHTPDSELRIPVSYALDALTDRTSSSPSG